MNNWKTAFFSLLLAAGLVACGGDSTPRFEKTPVDDIVKHLDKEQNYALLLYDMDLTEDNTYKHRYKVIFPEGGELPIDANTPTEEGVIADSASNTGIATESAPLESRVKTVPRDSLTDWHVVPERFFEVHSSDMGMEIVSKVDGSVSKVPTPPGYSHYVGNEKYGQWQSNSSGGSFWAFYGQYMFMSSMLHMMSPIGYGGYNNYRNNYRGRQPYYGPKGANGQTRYGTGSANSRSMNSSFSQRASSKPSLRNKVNSSISRSSNKATAGSRSSGRTGRASSRYSGSSRSRASSSGGK